MHVLDMHACMLNCTVHDVDGAGLWGACLSFSSTRFHCMGLLEVGLLDQHAPYDG